MDVLIGSTVFWVMSGLFLLGFVALPTLRAAALLVSATSTAMRSIDRWARSRPLGNGPERPLELTGLTPHLADLARQTRILTFELRRYTEQSVAWPDAAQSKQSWWTAFVGITGYESHTTATREAWEWVRAVERLPSADREQLASLGVTPEQVRELLGADLSVATQMSALAGIVDAFDERIGALGQSGYRGTSLGSHAPPAFATKPGREAEHDDEAVLRERRRRWAQLLDEHRPNISRIAGAHARSRPEREDLEQEISLALWQALPTFRGESSLRTFVHRIARYCHYRILRRRSRIQIEPYVDAIDDASTCVESWLSRAEQHDALHRALDRLPEGPRGALALRLEGKSYAEIAEILGISEQNVSVRLVRARQRIAADLRVA